MNEKQLDLRLLDIQRRHLFSMKNKINQSSHLNYKCIFLMSNEL